MSKNLSQYTLGNTVVAFSRILACWNLNLSLPKLYSILCSYMMTTCK